MARNVKYKIEPFIKTKWFSKPTLKFALVKNYESWDNHIFPHLSGWVKRKEVLATYDTREEAENILKEFSKDV